MRNDVFATTFEVISIEMDVLIFTSVISLLLNAFLIKTGHLTSNYRAALHQGRQAIHKSNTQRVAGLPLFIGFIFAALMVEWTSNSIVFWIIVAVTPVFMVGLVEDLTNDINPFFRLIVAFFSAFVFCLSTGFWITSLDFIPFYDRFDPAIVGIVATVFFLSAFINATNIIDGLNGLSIISALLMSLALGYLAIMFDDIFVVTIVLIFIASALGCLGFIFPFGKIFLGDGGAYFNGAIISIVATMLLERHEALNPLAVVLILSYPLYELSRTVFRRLFAQGSVLWEPDLGHLHSKVYRVLKSHGPKRPEFQNSFSAIIVLALPLFCCVWTILFFDQTSFLIGGMVIFAAAYELAMLLATRKIKQTKTKMSL